jgi:hypothetical protein
MDMPALIKPTATYENRTPPRAQMIRREDLATQELLLGFYPPAELCFEPFSVFAQTSKCLDFSDGINCHATGNVSNPLSSAKKSK